jgi:methionyl-tRNA synthetase
MNNPNILDTRPKYYLTTPIYYANSRPHVGSAYTTIVCDVIARYKRMCGYDVAYLTGTDEHGVNIERAAEKAGISPAELVDRNQKIFLELWKLLGIQYTHFIRTTETRHARAVQNLIRRTLARDKGLPAEKRSIFKRRYEGRYCIYDNLYISDTPEAADCPNCGRPGELVSEDNYFFRLSAYQERLLELYAKNPQFVHPDFRFNEVKSFVEGGLKDLSISRKSIKWGIPWPDDPEHIFYVWYDALTSYMSGIGFVDGEHDGPDFRYWPADIHAMGKEIIRFHAVYWPAFLMAAGMPLPRQIVAHGWLLFEQEKMSKSKGNVAYPEPIVKVLGNDALRYYLLREVVFGQDGNFSRDALITRYNADLANGLGNLASRVLTMIQQYCDGQIPVPDLRPVPPNLEAASEKQIRNSALVELSETTISDVTAAYIQFNFSSALSKAWVLVAEADFYLTSYRPWAIAGDEAQRSHLDDTLYRAAEILRLLSVLAHPVLPDATQKVWEQLGQPGKLADVRIDQLQWGGLKPGTRIGKPEAVFPRTEKKEAMEKIETMENEIRNPGAAAPAATSSTAAGSTTPAGAPAGAAAAAPALGAKITIDDFAKVELRVGVVKSAEKVQGADKLLKVMVDIGDEVRQVLAGIALAYAPEELVGRKVVVVTNLAPRKMRGQESNGMLLAASDGADGKPVLVTFAEDIPDGAKVK